MSVHWMSWVWESGPCDPVDRYILLKLADNADQEGRCFPSMSDISVKTCYSESTIRRAIQNLSKGGWLTVIKGLGKGNNSQYQLLKKVSEENLSERKVSERKVSGRKVSGRLPKGVTQKTKGVRVTEPPHPHKGVTIKNHQEPSLFASSDTSLPAIGTLPCLQGKMWSFTQEDLDGWKEAYPAIDVLQELRADREWLKANPRKMKTTSGMRRHVNSWLARAQNNSHSNGNGHRPINFIEEAGKQWLARRKQNEETNAG